jgi:hypothetical protein
LSKWLFIILSMCLLVGCSSNKPTEEAAGQTTDSNESVEETQEELNEELRNEAIEASFVKLNGDEVKEDTPLYLEGEVSTILSDTGLQTFSFLTTEPEGSGMYTIVNATIDKASEGDQVKLYGKYAGKDDTGVPKINVTIIE